MRLHRKWARCPTHPRSYARAEKQFLFSPCFPFQQPLPNNSEWSPELWKRTDLPSVSTESKAQNHVARRAGVGLGEALTSPPVKRVSDYCHKTIRKNGSCHFKKLRGQLANPQPIRRFWDTARTAQLLEVLQDKVQPRHLVQKEAVSQNWHLNWHFNCASPPPHPTGRK